MCKKVSTSCGLVDPTVYSRVVAAAVPDTVRVVGGIRGILPVVLTPQVVAVLVGNGVIVETRRCDDRGAEHGIVSLV